MFSRYVSLEMEMGNGGTAEMTKENSSWREKKNPVEGGTEADEEGEW